jgi:hypothetical protein
MNMQINSLEAQTLFGNPWRSISFTNLLSVATFVFRESIIQLFSLKLKCVQFCRAQHMEFINILMEYKIFSQFGPTNFARESTVKHGKLQKEVEIF